MLRNNQAGKYRRIYGRRRFIDLGFKSSVLVTAALSGLLKPLTALAKRNSEAFQAKTEKDALAELFPDQQIEPSDRIEIGVHDLVENGAFVPVSVETVLPDVKSIVILADKNPNPLIAKFNLAPPCQGFVATRLKVAEPSNIIVIVESGNKLYSARKFIEVVAGGCG